MAKNIIIRTVDEGLHKSLKVKAAQEGVTLQDLLKSILAKALEK